MKKKLMFAAVLLSAAMLFGCSADKKEGQETTAAVKTESTKAEEKTEEKTEEAKDSAGDAVKANKPYKLALITMDSIDQHWVTLNEGAQAEAKADGVEVKFMSPDTKDDSKQIE